MNYKAIIVDDEKKACEFLQLLVEKTKAFTILGSFTNPLEAFESLETLTPEIVFLDVDMPILNGIQFAEKALLKYHGLRIVITTAHEKYAIEALNTGVYGYLLKPYNYSSICDLIGRLLKEPKTGMASSTLMFSTNEKEYFFKPRDILFLEADGNYSDIHTVKQEIIKFSKTLKYFLDYLPESNFLRLSRSLIVNKDYLHCIDKKKGTATLVIDSGETTVLKIKTTTTKV